MADLLVKYENLSHQFKDGKTVTFQSETIESKEHTLLLGGSGRGKTTLLHILAGLLKPTTGQVSVLGQNIFKLSSRARDLFRGAHFGLIFQQAHLIKSLNVMENLEVASFFGKTNRDDKFLNELLANLAISELKFKKVTAISQGQAQRVAIARALVNKPKVIFCDEPTASLDDQSCDRVIELLKKQADIYGATLIIATHDHRIKSQFNKRIEL